MKVGEFIEALQEFDPELEVAISDGYEGLLYRPAFNTTTFSSYREDDGSVTVDIGIGGNRVKEEAE